MGSGRGLDDWTIDEGTGIFFILLCLLACGRKEFLINLRVVSTVSSVKK